MWPPVVSHLASVPTAPSSAFKSSRGPKGAFARIVGCGKGRYRVRLDNGGGAPSDTPLGVKPGNVTPVPGPQLEWYHGNTVLILL